jgi:hypothetical protein
MISRRFVPVLGLAAVAGWLMTGAAARASEGTVTGTLSAGQAFVQPFTATTTGSVALRLGWDDPSARLTLFLLKRGPTGAYTRIAAATGAEMPQLIVLDVVPGRYRVRVQVPHGTTTYQLWTRYPTAPPAQPLPGYLTIMFGRSMIGAGTASCALRSRCRVVADDRGIAAGARHRGQLQRHDQPDRRLHG